MKVLRILGVLSFLAVFLISAQAFAVEEETAGGAAAGAGAGAVVGGPIGAGVGAVVGGVAGSAADEAGENENRDIDRPEGDRDLGTGDIEPEHRSPDVSEPMDGNRMDR